MTLVNQDTVLEAAQTMGDFTTRQMAVRVYGDLEYISYIEEDLNFLALFL